MTDHLEATQAEKPKWSELVLYLVVGFGLYLLASLPIAFWVAGEFSNITLWVTALIGILNFICLVGTVYLTGIRRGKLTWAGLGFIPPVMKLEWFLLALLVSLVLIPFRSLSGALVEWLLAGNLESLQMRSDLLFAGAEPSFWNFLVSLLIIGILIPISEELYFRGLLYRWFQLRFRLWPAILLSSLIFGLAHYDSLAVIASSFILGVASAYAMERTKSIWVPIVMHAVTNTTAVVVIYAFLAVQAFLESV